MGVIKEVHSLIDNKVFIRYGSDGEEIQRVGIYGFSKEYEGNLYYIITDLNGRRIKEANGFLNVDLADSEFKKREQAFSALKIFLTFVQLFNIDYKNGFDKKKASLLTTFLQGISTKDNSFDLEFKTKRKNSTIKTYYAVYRQFYEWVFNNKDTAFHSKITVPVMEQENGAKTITSYTEDPKISKKTFCPKYIKHHEYYQTLRMIDKKYFKRDKIIVMLMYEYGLRIGEVLGLTIEDMHLKADDLGNYYLYLRNRLSDKPYQRCKRLPLGEERLISVKNKQLIKDIKKYYEETRSAKILNKSKKKKENLRTKAVADQLSLRRDIRVNQYIFLAEQTYSPLTQVGWGNRLKGIFEDVGINTDVKSKEDGLSHRFRHGFAMELIFRGKDKWQVAEALRHNGIGSVEKYWHSEPEDIVYASQRRAEIQKEQGIHFDDIEFG